MESMQSTGTKQARENVTNSDAVTVAISSTAAVQSAQPRLDVAMEHRVIGYGLPCAKCRAYYPSDMHACPICKSQERVSATAVDAPHTAGASVQPDEAKLLIEERERQIGRAHV